MTDERARILVVEDDENLGLALTDNLVDEGYEVTLARTGHEALARVDEVDPSLVVLDLMLPDTDGYMVCARLRKDGYRKMVLMLTARTLEEDLVRGFEVGADDYLTKPYRLRELLARVRALLRREDPKRDERIEFGKYVLDARRRTVEDPEGVLVELTRTEFDLLHYFLRHRDRALTRDELLAEVWRGVVVDPRTVDNFVSNLKRKLEPARQNGCRITTLRGIGYRMEGP